MQLRSLIANRKTMLKSLLASLCITMIVYSNFVIADSITYSPDQWPRHWNGVMNNSRSNGYRTNSNNSEQTPSRSPMWGVVPVSKQKPRRSMRPEYDTNSHMNNYYGQNNYRGNYSTGFHGYGFQTPYVAPLMSPYAIAPLAPGLAAPGIPFGAYPFMGGFPGLGNRW